MTHNTMQSQFLKAAAIILIISSLVFSQVKSAALHKNTGSQIVRFKRMTPFWRWISIRPVGASCRDDYECSTKLCRKHRCSITVLVD
ncbi:liver-expressed antimicrobial peptide 2-like [Latimeria chalumnae]|uniref:liver-expressed antimicrobial peptide 2-like n=1 Tax=Latimeria chalumnae TaxID=7897 RepID=UPI0003C10D72